MKRIAKVDQEYAGKQVRAGESFEVEENHIVLLLAIGRIELEQNEAVPDFRTRSMEAGQATGYLTREMKPRRTLHRKAV